MDGFQVRRQHPAVVDQAEQRHLFLQHVLHNLLHRIHRLVCIDGGCQQSLGSGMDILGDD